MSAPARIQLKRTKGWKMPANTVKVDRTTKWGNPFVVGKDNPFLPGRIVEDRRHAMKLYQSFAPQATRLVEAARAELRGKNLACWCGQSPDPYEKYFCHADVLLELANSEPQP